MKKFLKQNWQEIYVFSSVCFDLIIDRFNDLRV